MYRLLNMGIRRMYGRALQMGVNKHLIEGVAFVNGERWINVEYIWKDCKDEDEFIKRFSKAYLHETIHLMLLNVPDRYAIGEEKIIRKYIDGEKWTARLERLYRDEKNDLPKRKSGRPLIVVKRY